MVGLTDGRENITQIGRSLNKLHMLFKRQSDIQRRQKDHIYKRENDNIYKIGTVVTTKENPNRRLIIKKYIHRTYYCAVAGDAATNNLKYFERDLVVAQPEDSISIVVSD